MRKLLFIGVITLFSAMGMAQEICGTDYFIEKEIAKNPALRQELEKVWEKSDGPLVQSAQRSAQNGPLIIPVVFHIFHDNGNGNISMAQIESAVDMLNEDFRRTNSDTNLTRNLFKPHAADVEVEFRLARLDPNGNCTNGVVRLNNASASYDADNGVKPLSYWPSSKYMNIWVVNNIESSSANGIILGYAQFPGWGSWNTYGVVIRNDRVGRTGTAGFGDRTLTHELGHCLNLMHTFQSGCGSSCSNSGDRVCDTPPSAQSTQGCSQTQNTCSNDASGSASVYNTDVVDQIENYMSYDDCQNMFSEGQKVRVQNVLNTEATLINLTSQSNLVATGVANYTEGVCKADFESDKKVVCVGEAVQFTDLSYFNPVAHNWGFTGGFPAVSGDQNPVVTYSVPGVYPVSLTISDSNSGSVSETKQSFITVISSMLNTTPLTEDFESAVSLEDIYWSADYDSQTNFGWILSKTGGSSGSNAIKANVYNQSGEVSIESDAYDLSNLTNGRISFKYAYAFKPGSAGNLFRVYVSTDCGETWKVKFANGDAGLATSADRNTPYDVPVASDFVQHIIQLDSSFMSDNVRVKFELRSKEGNNLFIDDIQILGTLSDNVILKYPLNTQTDVIRNPVFNWNASNSATEYKIDIDTSASFNSTALVSHTQARVGSGSLGTDTEYKPANLLANTTYYWQVSSLVNGVVDTVSTTWMFTTNNQSDVTSVVPVLETSFEVNVFPNPASGYVNVTLNLGQSENIQVEVLTLSGSVVHNVFNGEVTSGMNTLGFDATGWASGVYMVRIQGEKHMEVKKLIIE